MNTKSFSQYNVLIVDDAPIVVLTLRNMLTKLGFSDKRIFTARLANTLVTLGEGNSERELVIVNLCLAEHDYHSALKHYHAYMEINKDTFRNNTFAKLNMIRILLYCVRKLEGREDLLVQAKNLFKSITSGPENRAAQDELDLIAAHIAI